MRALGPALLALCLTTSAFPQSFEGAISGGVSRIGGGGDLGSFDPTGATRASLDNGFRLAFRMSFNPKKLIGYEFGYAYNRTNLAITGSGSEGMAIHQGFGDVLLHATPEGARLRPFVAGGVNFSNFVPPGQSAQYGQGETKFGFNYGAGLKVKVAGPWQVRFDVRQFNTGKPFGLLNNDGRLLQTEISVGIGFML
jgi:opacity protein-like surface antigen